jgi:hypothetical protein
MAFQVLTTDRRGGGPALPRLLEHQGESTPGLVTSCTADHLISECSRADARRSALLE